MGGSIAQILWHDPAAPGSLAEINQRRCLEESGQWLENVDRTQLVAS